MKLKRFKLNALSAEELRQKEMDALIGGNSCSCSCYWRKKGGSSLNANNMANYQSNYSSTHGCNQFTYDDDNGENYWPEALHA